MNEHGDSAEVAAARHVVAVVGGEFEIHDTGDEPGQYDVNLKTGEGVSVALEVTSFGGDDWKRTAARDELFEYVVAPRRERDRVSVRASGREKARSEDRLADHANAKPMLLCLRENGSSAEER